MTRMHADEVETDATLVRRLLASQFPHWAGLPIERVASAGTDHAIYRLGDEMSVRLPRLERVVGQVLKEQRWLPVLAPRLPLAIPRPLALGEPGDGYPWPWSVYEWLEGEDATVAPIADLRQAADDLARFVAALRAVDPEGGPAPGAHNFGRGVPLATRDEASRRAIAALGDTIDGNSATAAWESALRAPWEGAPVWLHGDLQPLNLLCVERRVTAVIDFGGLAVGDPACDLMPAWSLLTPGTREVFRGALDVDDATWARGRGWALSVALIALPYYRTTNPVLAAISQRTIDEVLADGERGGRR